MGPLCPGLSISLGRHREIYYSCLCPWNSSEWASPPVSIRHPLARPPSSTAIFDYHSIFMRGLVCAILAFLYHTFQSTEISLSLSFLCLKLLCWFPVVLSLRPSHHRGGKGPSSCLKQPAATSLTYVSSLQASSLQCDPPIPKQSLSTLCPQLYSYQKPGLELNSGPARPLKAGSAASWKKLSIWSQLCPGRNRAVSFMKGFRTMVSLSFMLGRSCHQRDTVIVGTYPSRVEQVQRYECVIAKRHNVWHRQSFWGRMSKQSAQILELFCRHLIFSIFSECISLSFHLSLVCVLTEISGLHMAQSTSFMVFFTYVYDALQIILIIEIISVY